MALKLSKEEIEEARKAVPEESPFKLSAEEIEEAKAAVPDVKEPSALDKAETLLRGGISGLTFGLADPVVAGAEALIRKGVEKLPIGPSEEEIIAAGLEPTPEPSLGELYSQAQARYAGMKEELPGYDIAGQIAGGFSPVGPAAAAFKAVKGAAKAVPVLGKSAVARGVLEGGLYAAGTAGARQAVQGVTGYEGEPEAPLKEQIELGTLVGGAFPAAGALVRGVKTVGKAGMNTLLGIKEKTLERFLNRADDVINAKSKEEIVERAKAAVDDIKQRASVAKLDLTDEVTTGLGVLKQKIIDASENAYAALEASDKKVPLSVVKNALKEAGNELEKPGMVGGAVQDAKQKLSNFINSLEGLPEELDGVTLKRVLRSLDDDLEFLSQGEFAKSRAQSVMTKARGNVDGVLKSAFPSYAEAIKPVRDLAQFHTEVMQNFKKPEQIFSSLSRFGKPGQEIKDARLKRLFQETGVDPDRFRRAQAEADFLKNFTDNASIENKVKGMMGERSEALRAQWKALSEGSGEDFLQFIEDLSTKTQFESEFLRGSRNVNLWTVMLGGGGAAVGGGLPGAIMGAAIGATIDKYGPKMGQQVLGAYAKVRGMPTIDKVRKAFDGLPKQVVDEAIDGFKRTVINTQSDAERTFIPEEMRGQVGSEIKNSDALSDVEKARLMISLVKRGEIDSQSFKKIIVGREKVEPEMKVNPSMEQFLRKKPQPVDLNKATDFIKGKRAEEY